MFKLFEHTLSEFGIYSLVLLDGGSAELTCTTHGCMSVVFKGTLDEVLRRILRDHWYDSWYDSEVDGDKYDD